MRRFFGTLIKDSESSSRAPISKESFKEKMSETKVVPEFSLKRNHSEDTTPEKKIKLDRPELLLGSSGLPTPKLNLDDRTPQKDCIDNTPARESTRKNRKLKEKDLNSKTQPKKVLLFQEEIPSDDE